MQATILLDTGERSCTVFGRGSQRDPTLVDSNQYLIKHRGKGLLVDPQGSWLFPAMIDCIHLEDLESMVATHQDPDVIFSIASWAKINPGMYLYMPKVLSSFVAHHGGWSMIRTIAEKGQTLPLNGSSDLRLIPVRQSHSSDNFSLYDPTACIFFSGDIGSADVLKGEGALFVEDFAAYASSMEAFHRRLFASNRAKNEWVRRVRELEVHLLCPQHGAIFRGDDVDRFLDWFEALEVGAKASGGHLPAKANGAVALQSGAPDVLPPRAVDTPRLIGLAAALEDFQDIVMVTDAEQNITHVNGAFEKATGYTRDEVVGKKLSLLAGGKYGRAAFEDMRRALVRDQVWSGSLVNRRKNGQLLHVSALVVAVRDAPGNVHRYISVEHDTARKEEFESRALDSQKLEIMGLLSGGIAHDLNNTLQAIVGNTELLMIGLATGPKQAEYLATIREASKQAKDLVGEMVDVSRQLARGQGTVALPLLMNRVVRLARPILGNEITVRISAADDVLPALAEAGQINTLLLNLIINAAHAMPKGGVLSLDARNVLAPDAEDYFGKPFSGAYVRLRVSDTGTGMTREVLGRIFEPFFSTKDPQQGTGLGLFMVHQIIERNGGYIQVESIPGSGTKFDLFLRPRSQEADPARESQPPANPERTAKLAL